ncbi:MAG: SDR family oxidoreductase [Candidatus Omnitrophica bacterium]|nr:SDR family oxidoreductase [Candidatus Omnitrophota bacterium]MBU1923063.1 SDR family oxidoreductase [Candidatus Omnitrophota bacterium]
MNNGTSKSAIFITGATGLVGSYLLKILLKNGRKVFALARSKAEKSAKDRVVEVLNFWDNEVYPKYGKNLIVFDGDITEDNLGLNEKGLTRLKNEVEEIFHCAASIAFNWPLDKMRQLNVEGTRKILDFALTCPFLEKVNHLSTAYVCGDHKGAFSENDLDVGQKFNTTYEQSKFEAEKLIADYRNKGLWIDIFRPPVIAGESISGKTFRFQGFYQLLHICSLEIFETLPGKNILMNLVPIDYLCESITKIAANTKEKNKNYHPFDPNPVPLEEVLSLYSVLKKVRKPRLVTPDEFAKTDITVIQANILRFNINSFAAGVILDSRRTMAALKNMGFEFPKLNEKVLTRLMRFYKDKKS